MRRHAKAIVAASALLLLTMVLGVNFATATAPTVSIDAPSSVSYTSVHLSGKVDPEDQEASWRFEYTAEPENEFSWQWGPSGGPLAANSGEAPVEGDLTGLQPSTQYSIRLVAENTDGQTISSEPHPSFTTDAVAPAAVSIDGPSAITSNSAHFSGTINPGAPGGNPAAFDVNWSFQCTPECPGLGGGTIPADGADHTVEADATGLKPGTVYEVTLVAQNAGGWASAGPESFSTPAAPPVIRRQGADTAYDEATLEAEIDTGNSETTYKFEYGLTSAYGQVTSVRTVAGSTEDQRVKAQITGLALGATYHFRVEVQNSLGGEVGQDRTFSTEAIPGPDTCPNAAVRAEQQASRLPACRAYELVSPPKKNHNDVGYHNGTIQASVNGDGVAYLAAAVFADAPGSGLVVNYRSTRGPGGWSTMGMMPAQEPEPWSMFAGPMINWISPSLDAWVLTQKSPALVPEATKAANLYLHGADGVNRLLTPGKSPGQNFAVGVGFIDISADQKVVLFTTQDSLTPEAPSSFGDKLYKWTEGSLELVSILPSGTPSEGAAGWFHGTHYFTRTLSADGSRVIFATPDDQLYLRDGNETVRVSASQASAPGTTEPAEFGTASQSASEIFFLSEERLTDDSTACAGCGDGKDLYRYSTETGELTDETVDASPQDPFGASVQGVVGASDSGDHVYFAAKGHLGDAPPSGVGPRQAGLYLLHDGDTNYIGALHEDDRKTWSHDQTVIRPSRVSSDGRFLLIRSSVAMTGEDTNGHPQLYRYDALRDSLVCVSCRPNGSPSQGEAALTGNQFGVTVATYNQYESRNMTEDGRRIFFNSADALVAPDVNGQIDVYEWVDGAVRLLSTGTQQSPAYFGDADPSGNNLFINTPAALVASDTDDNRDIYAVRVNGGTEGSRAPTGPPRCTGEACKSGGSGTPPFSLPASATSVSGKKQRNSSRCAKKRRGQRKAGSQRRCVKRAASGKRGKRAKRPAHHDRPATLDGKESR